MNLIMTNSPLLPCSSAPLLLRSLSPPLNCGITYVTYGVAAQREAAASLATLRETNDYPVAAVGEAVEGADYHIPFPTEYEAIPASRWAKLNLDSLSPFQYTLYLDADTRVRGDLSPGFVMVAAGWHMVMAPSGRQGADVMGHLGAEDRAYTLAALGNSEPLQWQAGVFFFDRERVGPLFAAWRAEWRRFADQDQGALLRALAATQVPVWALGEAWNCAQGEVVEHLFGRAR